VAAANRETEAFDVKYPGRGATLEGYLARPIEGRPFPAVIVIHDELGLTEREREAARTLAREGFAALAVDQLSRKGGTASFLTPDAARAAVGTLADQQVISDLEAARNYLAAHAAVRKDAIGVAGFGWSGQRALRYAAENPHLKAVVVFGSSAPQEEHLKSIQCPVRYEDTAAEDGWERAVQFFRENVVKSPFASPVAATREARATV
jgi:carboxymethylenebutenolidase